MGTSGVQGTSDVQAPTVTLNGNNPATVAVGAAYSDLGAIIADDVDQNLGYTVSLDNATSTDLSNFVLDTSVGGTHYIVFTAADQAGNTAHATRTVIVGDGSATTSAQTSSTDSQTTNNTQTSNTQTSNDVATSSPDMVSTDSNIGTGTLGTEATTTTSTTP